MTSTKLQYPNLNKVERQFFGILNLGHWNLFEIWFLVLVIFMIFIDQVTFVKSVNYLFK